MGTGEARCCHGLDDENRIGEVMWGKVDLTCAVEFPILRARVVSHLHGGTCQRRHRAAHRTVGGRRQRGVQLSARQRVRPRAEDVAGLLPHLPGIGARQDQAQHLR